MGGTGVWAGALPIEEKGRKAPPPRSFGVMDTGGGAWGGKKGQAGQKGRGGDGGGGWRGRWQGISIGGKG